MIKKFKQFFASKQEKKDFSLFFTRTSPEERHKVLRDVVRKANQDQRKLIGQYKQSTGKSI